MFISQAMASTGQAATGGDAFMSLLPILLIFVVFYLMLLRPQQKRMKEHRNLLDNLQKGDKVITGGGVIANVKKVVNQDEVLLELSKGVEVSVVKGTIQGLWNGPAPKVKAVNDEKKTAKKPAKKAKK